MTNIYLHPVPAITKGGGGVAVILGSIAINPAAAMVAVGAHALRLILGGLKKTAPKMLCPVVDTEKLMAFFAPDPAQGIGARSDPAIVSLQIYSYRIPLLGAKPW